MSTSSSDRPHSIALFFFFNDTATTEIYTLSLHDALPISEPSLGKRRRVYRRDLSRDASRRRLYPRNYRPLRAARSEEHTSELQSPCNLVCRLLLEKKKNSPLSSVYTDVGCHNHQGIMLP